MTKLWSIYHECAIYDLSAVTLDLIILHHQLIVLDPWIWHGFEAWSVHPFLPLWILCSGLYATEYSSRSMFGIDFATHFLNNISAIFPYSSCPVTARPFHIWHRKFIAKFKKLKKERQCLMRENGTTARRVFSGSEYRIWWASESDWKKIIWGNRIHIDNFSNLLMRRNGLLLILVYLHQRTTPVTPHRCNIMNGSERVISIRDSTPTDNGRRAKKKEKARRLEPIWEHHTPFR